MPSKSEFGRLAWICMFLAELCFGFYWIITQSLHWNVIYTYPYKNKLFLRYEENLPDVDIFVCIADPIMEPPTMVINTILSVISYNYPTQKLSVYLSDDGGSQYTFYALLEASQFSKYWILFCKRFNEEPTSPAAYFQHDASNLNDKVFAQEWSNTKYTHGLVEGSLILYIEFWHDNLMCHFEFKLTNESYLSSSKLMCNFLQKLYEDMKSRIEASIENGSIPNEIKAQHKGFSEWNTKVTKQDHHSIVQIITWSTWMEIDCQRLSICHERKNQICHITSRLMHVVNI
ncbi:hypothetical protein H5410_060182 [Solanum commersonii]|uniref:Uncharacterized protein n=1 Tax=Solanum commersonii TaxID=4109 RepID=A0A9J5W597_SOLCO|nr:hypothetical protein H5410_060182 [Solanum commersonii]